MKRVAFSILLLGIGVGLGGCPPAALVAAQAGIGLAVDTYCTGVTEEARQALRDKVTGGVKVLPCVTP